MLFRRQPWPLMLSALLCALGVVLPLGYLIDRAFEADQSELADLLLRRRNLDLLFNTLLLAVGVCAVVTLAALPAAWLTSRCRLWGRQTLTLLLVLPLAVPGYLMAFTFLAAGGPYGSAARLLGVTVPVISGYWGALAALSLYLFPYMYLNLQAAFSRLDASMEEAARSLGAGSARVFFRVVLPQLIPALTAGGLLVVLHVIADFGVVSLMRYETLSYALYQQYIGSFDRIYAAWIALMLLALSSVFIAGELLVVRNLQLERVGRGAARRGSEVRLEFWAIPAYLFLGGIVAAGVVVPLATILFWATQAETPPWSSVWPALFNSARASFPAALLATTAALPVAFLAVRYPGRMSRVFERASYLGYATPPMAFALGLVYLTLYTDLLADFYQTIWVLIYAYTFRFIAEALGPLRSALMAAPRRYDEAARSLGASPFGGFFRVTFPLIRRGVVVGMAFVFLSCMKELPMTVLLAPIGFDALAYNVWDATNEALYAFAAPYALAIVVCSSMMVGVLLFSRRESS